LPRSWRRLRRSGFPHHEFDLHDARQAGPDVALETAGELIGEELAPRRDGDGLGGLRNQRSLALGEPGLKLGRVYPLAERVAKRGRARQGSEARARARKLENYTNGPKY
jgi:hypothetical protein